MNNTKFIVFVCAFCCSACRQKAPAQPIPNPEAIKLNNQAMKLVPYLTDADSARKALFILDKATAIDSNYF